MRARDQASNLLGVLAVAAAVLAVGGGLRWTVALVAILTTIALVPAIWSRRGFSRRPPLILALLVACGLTAIQLVPLPAGIVEALSPTHHTLRQQGTEAAGVSAWTTITMDVPGSLRALAFYLTLLGVAVVSLRLAASERGRLFCLGAVAAIGGFTALVVGVHELFDASSLYGIYTPNQASPPVLGPLLNANHLGGLMALCAVVSIGLIAYTKQSMAARASWVVCAIGCVVVVVATLSRGAVLALVTGFGVTAAVYLAHRLARSSDPIGRSSRKAFIIGTLPIAVCATCVVVLIVYLGGASVTEQIADTSLQEISEPRSKYAAWRSSETLVSESPWVGVGRGAFEPTFTRVHPASAFVTFSHLENEYIQGVVEWGIPGAILLALAVGWFAVVAIRRWREGALAAAALGGVATIAVQSNVDFGIELLGIAAPLVVVAATLSSVPLKPLEPAALRRARALRLGHLVALTLAAIILCLPLTRSIHEDHLDLDKGAAFDEIRASIERHPLDYYGYAMGADALARARDPRAAAMLNHALALHPTHPGLHRFAGRMLVLAKRSDQAAIEFAQALRGTREPQALLAEIVQLFSPEHIAIAIPTDYENVRLVAQTLEKEKRGEAALAWLTRVVRLYPKSDTAVDLMYSIAMSRGEWKAAEGAAHLRHERLPTPPNKLALAQLFMKRAAYRDVLDVLGDISRWHGLVSDQLTAWLLKCDAVYALGDLDETTRCLRKLDASGLITAGGRTQVTRRLEVVADARKAAILAPQLLPSITPPTDEAKQAFHARVIIGETTRDITTRGPADLARDLCKSVVAKVKPVGALTPRVLRECEPGVLPSVTRSGKHVLRVRRDLDDIEILLAYGRRARGATATVEEISEFATPAACEQMRERLGAHRERSSAQSVEAAAAALTNEIAVAKSDRDRACTADTQSDTCAKARMKLEVLERAAVRTAKPAVELVPPCRPE